MFLGREHSLIIGRVHSIESFGTMDGPGIRMVIPLSECPMRCLYYYDPDTWDPGGGSPMTAEEIPDQYEQARPFYKKGSITTSGDESLMQIGFMAELFGKAEKSGVHICLDTSGITFNPGSQTAMTRFDRPLALTDLILLDVKHIDPKEHVKLCAQPQDNILALAAYLGKKQIPAWIHHVVVPGITDQEEYLYHPGRYLGTPKNVKVLDVLPYHGMRRAKYGQLGIPYPLEDTAPLPPVKAAELRKITLQGMRDERVHYS